MKTARFAAFFAAAVVVFASCASQGATAKRPPKEKSVEERVSGKVWLLAGYAAGQAFIPIEPGHGSSARLVFSPDGTVAGSTGWNSVSGAWSIRRETRPGEYPVTLRITKSTRLAPPGAVAERFERDVMKHLGNAAAIRLTRDEFRVLDGKGSVILHFIFRPTGF